MEVAEALPEDRTAAEVSEPRRRARILVIDDEPAIAKGLARVLRDHDVTVATDAREGLSHIANDVAFDVVLCDLMMPGMSGMELYAESRASHPDLAARIIFMTGGAFTPQLEEFLASVANASLAKPFDGAAVRAVVDELVNRNR